MAIQYSGDLTDWKAVPANLFLSDHDLKLYQGDVLQVLASMPDESVDCVVTSPPYWGLRDYGTGLWDGGDPDCDHAMPLATTRGGPHSPLTSVGARDGQNANTTQTHAQQFRETCGKCGARRVDQQLGLEPTPDLYVERIVAVFREVRRVLAAHGTCWVNLGDTYAANRTYQVPDNKHRDVGNSMSMRVPAASSGLNDEDGLIPAPAFEHGLKPKDLVGIPWRVAFALQADGWWLRADIVWSKPNPMPESVTDRPTKAHEYVFLLTKQPRYYFDQEAVRESAEYGYRTNPHSPPMPDGGNGKWRGTGDSVRPVLGGDDQRGKVLNPSAGRNVRSVWQIATQPYPEAHFATYPEELVRRCVLAGCPVRVCRVCGKPSERIVDVSYGLPADGRRHRRRTVVENERGDLRGARPTSAYVDSKGEVLSKEVTTLGWSDCGHNQWRPGTVLDPFIGSGTTCKVARDHGRHSIGIDLSADYLNLAARRLQQLSLLT